MSPPHGYFKDNGLSLATGTNFDGQIEQMTRKTAQHQRLLEWSE
jgi:hypothetical protein